MLHIEKSKNSTFQKPVVIGNVSNEELLKINTYFEENINTKNITKNIIIKVEKIQHT